MIGWEQPGYVVRFTIRAGGVSEGPYASLNLGRRTNDLPGNVDENRRRLCEEIGAEPEALAFNRQVHSTVVRRATHGGRGMEGDGLWTDEPRLPILAFSADCVPIAIARTDGTRALAVLHAGWRGLAAGIVEAGVRSLAGGPTAAIVGPAIGPCCYEVGGEVSERFDSDLTREGKLDLWSATERNLRAAGVEHVERVDLCTACHPELFFSHRRTGGVTGRQGVVGYVA